MGDPACDADHHDVAPFNDCDSLLTLVDTVSYYLFLKYVSSTTLPPARLAPSRLPYLPLAVATARMTLLEKGATLELPEEVDELIDLARHLPPPLAEEWGSLAVGM